MVLAESAIKVPLIYGDPLGQDVVCAAYFDYNDFRVTSQASFLDIT